MCLAGEGQAHHGTAVKAILHAENRGAAGKGTRNLDCVVHRFRTAVYQECFLGKVTGRELVEPFCQRYVALIAGYLKAEMEKGVYLGAQSA